MDMLQKLLDEEITFRELRERAMSFRSLEAVKTAFVRTTNSNNWETARELFPHHANVDRLKTFANLSFKGITLYYAIEYKIQIISCHYYITAYMHLINAYNNDPL